MITLQEIRRVAEANSREMTRVHVDQDGVEAPSISVVNPALRINELMVLYPLDNIQEIDNRSNSSLDTGAGLQTSTRAFFEQCPLDRKNEITIFYKDNMTNALTIGFFTGISAGLIPPAVCAFFTSGFGAFLIALVSVPVCALLGAVSGAVGGLIKSKLILQADPTYIEWVKQQTMQNLYETYKEYLRIYLKDRYQEFLCPITQDFPAIPFISPNGHVYDKEAIFAWLDEKENDFLQLQATFGNEYPQEYIDARVERYKASVCPMRGSYFTKTQMRYCYEFVLCMRRKLKDYMEENVNVPPIVAIGIETYLLSLKRTQNMITSKKIILLTQRMNHLGMPESEQESAIQRLLEDDVRLIA